MTRLLLVCLAAIIAGLPAGAQTVVVRSGEHEGFTRLVLKLPIKAEWAISQSGRSLSLSIDVPSIRFDVSRVYDRIPRTRVAGLSQQNPGADLVLSLGCACSVASFVDTPGILVIDIKDHRDNPEPRRRFTKLPINQNPYRFPQQAVAKEDALPAKRKLMLPVVIGQVPAPIAKPVPMPVAQRTMSPGAINISEERLLAQISRASDQGLVDLVESQRSAKPGGSNTGTPDQTVAQNDSVPVSLFVTTVIDRDLALAAQSLGRSETELTCLVDSQVALHEWGGSRPFAEEIGHWRSQLFGEFDRAKPDTALNLARAYLHFGFGAEAAQALDLSPGMGKESRILLALAQILDNGELKDSDPFFGQQPCDGDVALWAVLSSGSVAEDVNSNAINLAFSRLPPHLRSYLGPRLSQIFALSGDGPMASFILRTVKRTGAEPGSGIELATATVAEINGDTNKARQELTKSLASGSEHSPDALARLIENTFESRGSISPELPDLAAAYALEYRNAEIGTDLRRTRAIALALAGQFVDAFGTLPDLEMRDGPSGRLSALTPILALLSERADDVTFLRIVLGSPLGNPGALPAEVADPLARRLLDLGFAEQAAELLAAQEYPTSEERQRMRAEIALARQLPISALTELLGVNGTEAARLRAAAMWQQGDYQQAGQMLIDAGDFDAAARGFWLAEEWGGVPEQADAHYAQVVARSIQLGTRVTESVDSAPLAEARELMQNSSSSRAVIADLLRAVAIGNASSQ